MFQTHCSCWPELWPCFGLDEGLLLPTEKECCSTWKRTFKQNLEFYRLSPLIWNGASFGKKKKKREREGEEEERGGEEEEEGDEEKKKEEEGDEQKEEEEEEVIFTLNIFFQI